MKYQNLILAVLLGIASSLLILASTGQSAKFGNERRGTISGEVNDFPNEVGPWTVMIERTDGSDPRQVVTDKFGRFNEEVTPGLYVAYIMEKPGGVDKSRLAPFAVEAAATVKIEVTPPSDSVYCTAAGSKVSRRIILVTSTDADQNRLKGLHRPEFESFSVANTHQKPTKMVVEYCEKTKNHQLIQFTSAIVHYDAVTIFADNVLLDRQKLTLESWGRVGVLHHGERSPGSYAKADFRDGKSVVRLTPTPIPSTEGEGNIKPGKASFRLKFDEDGIAEFWYEDKARKLRLVSRKHGCLLVPKSSGEMVTFQSLAEATTLNRKLIGGQPRVVEFTVTLTASDKNTGGHFAISIPSERYENSGSVSGRIEVNPVSRNSEARAVPQ